MDNLQDIKRALVDTLSPEQKKHLDSVRWLFNQQRASGKTYLLCVEALLQVCEQGQAYVIDHSPHFYHSHYLKSMLLGIAAKAGLPITVKHEQGNVYKIRLEPSPRDYIYETRRSSS